MTGDVPVASSDSARFASPRKDSQPNLPTTLRKKNQENKGSSGQRYITRARVNEVAAQLTGRDRSIVDDLRRVHVATGEQLRRLHYPDTDSGRRLARRELTRLVELRVLARHKRRIGGVRAGSAGYVYALDLVGQRITRKDRKRVRTPWTPSQLFLLHALAVTELYVQLRAHVDVASQLVFQAEPACWRSFTGPGGRQLVLKPDAFITWTTAEYEDRYFVEVDRSTESLPRLIDKARLYIRYWQSGREQAQHSVFPRVLWTTPDEARRSQLVDALENLGAEAGQLFTVSLHERAAEPIASGSVNQGGSL